MQNDKDGKHTNPDTREQKNEANKLTDLDTLRRAWRAMPASEQTKSLIALYEGYTQRFLSDNARIWTTAASMIPLSLGGFVVLASVRHPSLFQIFLFPIASWVLMSVWLVIAENHRAFQQASLQKLADIERIWNFPDRPAKDVKVSGDQRFDQFIGGFASWLVSKNRVQRMRFILWGIVTLGTIVVILFWPGGIISQL